MNASCMQAMNHAQPLTSPTTKSFRNCKGNQLTERYTLKTMEQFLCHFSPFLMLRQSQPFFGPHNEAPLAHKYGILTKLSIQGDVIVI